MYNMYTILDLYRHKLEIIMLARYARIIAKV